MFKINNNQVPIEVLAEFAYNEQKGEDIIKNLEGQFGDCISIVEHFKSFFRLSIEKDMGLGVVFKHFESIRDSLFIKQYSISQTTLEKIFNEICRGKVRPPRKTGTVTK